MILNSVTDWIGNWASDFLHTIFIWIFDRMLYSIVGFLYQVFLIIGSFDLFGGPSTGSTDAAMSVYQGFTSRLYNIIGIAMIFVLSYQLLLYIINPDRKDNKSSKIVLNLVKSIILIIVLPLVFHYTATIEQHILISDNTIWSLVLGTGTSEVESASEAGNTMASMLYINMFHPTGTEYSDFYKTDGTMNKVDVACAGFNDTIGSDVYISETTGSKVAKTATAGAVLGAVLGGGVIGAGIGAGLGALIGLFTSKDTDGVTACEYYWYVLYLSGEPTESKTENGPETLLKNLSGAVMDGNPIGSNNKATILSSQRVLIDEISDEGTMEYMYFAPVVGVILVWMLLGYTMDIAYRAFKLAFLQMIAPIPVLIGILNEEIFDKWKKDIISTYLDIFVRVFVMAFVVLMITLVPSFIEALFSAFGSINTAGKPMLKIVTFIFMVLGLLRFGHDLPNIIKDFTKNASGKGILSGMNLNPNTSIKNTFNAAKAAGKPIGAAAGAGLGGVSSAINSGKRYAADHKLSENAGAREKWSRYMGIARNAGAGGMVGMVTGGKSGWQSGLSKGGFTNSITTANQQAYKGEQRRAHIWQSKSNGVFGEGGMLDVATNGRVGQFIRSFDGHNYTRDSEFESAQQINQVTKAGKNAFYASKLDKATTELTAQKADAMSKITQGPGSYTGQDGRTYSGTRTSIKQQMLAEMDGDITAQVRGAQWHSEQGTMVCEFNGREYTCGDSSDFASVEKQMKDDMIAMRGAAIDQSLDTGFKAGQFSTTFRGEEISAESATALDAAIERKITAIKKDVAYTAAAEAIRGTDGIEKAQTFAQNHQKLTVEYGDTLSDSQRDAIGKACSDALGGGTSALAGALGIDGSSAANYDKVMSKIADESFKRNYESLDTEQQKQISEELGKLFKDIIDADDKVVKSIQQQHDLYTGVATNRFTGTDINSLATGGGKGGKDGKDGKK